MFDWFRLSFELDIWGWLYLLGVITIGSFVVGATGFGGGIVRVPLLLQIFKPTTVTPIENILGFLNYIELRAEMAKSQKHKVFFPLIFGNIIGAVIGTLILLRFGTNLWLTGIIGVGMLIYQVYFLSRLMRNQNTDVQNLKSKNSDLFVGHGWSELRHSWRSYFDFGNLLHVLVGVVSGVMSATFAIGGPPVVIYLERIIKDRAILRSTITAFFFVNGFVQLYVLVFSGQANLQLFLTCFILFPFMTLGTHFGARQSRKMGGNEYKVWISVVIILASLFLIYRSYLGIK